MDKSIIESALMKCASIRAAARDIDTSLSNLRYWIKKHGIDTHAIISSSPANHYNQDSRRCPKCQLHKTKSEFYDRRGLTGTSVYCKTCTNEQTIERQRERKLQCIAYKGGKCCSCGYSKSPSALEFHHTDPSKKSFGISRFSLRAFDESLRIELDKCILLCANCHRETHDLDIKMARTAGLEPATPRSEDECSESS